MKRPIKFRGREFFSKKFIFGQTIRQTDDGFDMWTGDDWTHCTDLVQLVGFDENGREVYEGDFLVNDNGDGFFAELVGAVMTDEGFLHADIPPEILKLKEAQS